MPFQFLDVLFHTNLKACKFWLLGSIATAIFLSNLVFQDQKFYAFWGIKISVHCAS